jgi:hypothetical protein
MAGGGASMGTDLAAGPGGGALGCGGQMRLGAAFSLITGLSGHGGGTTSGSGTGFG